MNSTIHQKIESTIKNFQQRRPFKSVPSISYIRFIQTYWRSYPYIYRLRYLFETDVEKRVIIARVAELADAADLKSAETIVWVRVPPLAPGQRG